MGSTFYFLERPCETSAVSEWFGSYKLIPEAYDTDRGILFHFRELGPLQVTEDGSIDVRRSPLVSLVQPREYRGIFHTVGEVHFLVTPKRSIPGYDAIISAFRRWLGRHEKIFEQIPKPSLGHEYYLEGSIQNIAPVVYALPSGLEELTGGRYFISDFDTNRDLTQICKKLRLRGVECC